MSSRLIKCLIVVAALGMIAGCKLAVMAPSGGDVTSASGTKNCSGGSLCEYNITAANINETFTAVARPGYVFTKWSSGPGFLCSNSTSPTCVVNNSGLPSGDAIINAVIAGGTIFYALPLFDFVGIDTDGDGVMDHVDTDDDNDGIFDVDDLCPLDPNPVCGRAVDYVTIGNRLWAQPDLFTGVTWEELNSVCPNGACNGLINGYDVTGWRWANQDDMNVLFNYWIGAVEMGPGLDSYSCGGADCDDVVLPLINATFNVPAQVSSYPPYCWYMPGPHLLAGFRVQGYENVGCSMQPWGVGVQGRIRITSNGEPAQPGRAGAGHSFSFNIFMGYSFYALSENNPVFGVWLYRNLSY